MAFEPLPRVKEGFRRITRQLEPPPRWLFGAGPSNVSPRVLQAMSTPTVGPLDPAFLPLVRETQDLLRYLFQTSNRFTLPISGTGGAAMEAAIANLVEPGDVVLVLVNGYFGERLCEVLRRYGADVRRLERPWGQVFSLQEIQAGLVDHRPAILALVHAETSTGAEQPLAEIGPLCRRYDALLVVDAVSSLGGVPLFTDEWALDVVYGASQHCLSCPPGIAPLTMNERALDKVRRRQVPLSTWYFDAALLAQYWDPEIQSYHHTIPVNLLYALREALRMVAEEGLVERWQRHRTNAELLWLGLEDMRLECHVASPHRLASLTAVRVPEVVNGSAVVRFLLEHYNIEIADGLGALKDRVWRIGLMGYNSRASNVMLLLKTLEDALRQART